MKFSKIVREKFLRYIGERSLLSPEDKVIIALSGGPDSVCLFHLMTTIRKKMQLSIGAAYIDHGIRPAEVHKEIALVKRLAGDYGAPFYMARLNIPKAKSGFEAAARKLRYAALLRIAGENGCRKIATAHTLSDQAETVLLNIIRSTGAEGIIGIPSKRELIDAQKDRKVTVIRPLLGISRTEISEYLKENRLESATDTTNMDTRFSRNLVRLRVMPLLEKINPAVLQHLSNLALWADDARGCLNEKTARILPKLAKKRGNRVYVDLSALLKYNYMSKIRIIRAILSEQHTVPSLKQILSIIMQAERGKNKKAPYYVAIKRKK